MEQEEIDELKKKYGKVFKLNISDKDWYYRAMARDEFKIYSAKNAENADNITQLDLEDMIFETCNLNGIQQEDIQNLPAGVVALVADAIMKATGFAEDVIPEEL